MQHALSSSTMSVYWVCGQYRKEASLNFLAASIVTHMHLMAAQ